MAFNFNWTEFDDHFHEEAKKMLTGALNKGNKPARIKDDIQVKELHMGTQPPELEMLEIGELSADKFRGIFKLTYAGDAYIVLQTKVQANPVNERRSELSIRAQSHIVAADTPLVVPMQLRISDLRLRGFMGLVVCKRNGVTLSFKNDPLEQVKVSSTFDGLTSVQRFLQDEIEKQLRSMFQEDLPTLVHNLSRRFLDDERLREKEKASAMRQVDSAYPNDLSVDTDKAHSLPGSRINTGVRTSFFSQPTSPIGNEPHLIEHHQPLRVRARDVHSMPDRLPGQRQGRSAISSNSSSESSSSISKIKERQHMLHQNRTVRFSEDLYMHQRSLSVDGTELNREKRKGAELPHDEHVQSRQFLHQQQHSVVAAASDGIYHSFAPLFREKGLRELAETKSAIGVSGETSTAYRPRIVHSSSTVSMPVTMTATASNRSKDIESLSGNGYNNANGRQRTRSQSGGTTPSRTSIYTSPTDSRHSTRPTSPLLESVEVDDRIHITETLFDNQLKEMKHNDLIDPFSRDHRTLIDEEELPPRSIVLQPNDSRHAAQLATLFSTNHTLSPYTRPVGHFATRSTLGAVRSIDVHAKASRRTVVGKFHLPWNIAGTPTQNTNSNGTTTTTTTTTTATSNNATPAVSPMPTAATTATSVTATTTPQEPRPRRSTHAAITTTTTMTTTHIQTISSNSSNSTSSLSTNHETINNNNHNSNDKTNETVAPLIQRHSSDGDPSVRGILLHSTSVKSPILGPLGLIPSGIGRMPIIATRRAQTTATDSPSSMQ